MSPPPFRLNFFCIIPISLMIGLLRITVFYWWFHEFSCIRKVINMVDVRLGYLVFTDIMPRWGSSVTAGKYRGFAACCTKHCVVTEALNWSSNNVLGKVTVQFFLSWTLMARQMKAVWTPWIMKKPVKLSWWFSISERGSQVLLVCPSVKSSFEDKD
jgi:hypothetical protein